MRDAPLDQVHIKFVSRNHQAVRQPNIHQARIVIVEQSSADSEQTIYHLGARIFITRGAPLFYLSKYIQTLNIE